jgi:hypothetical protein
MKEVDIIKDIDYIKKWCKGTIASHNARGFEIAFTREQLQEHVMKIDKCVYCKRTLDWSSATRLSPLTPSLDRIDLKNKITLYNIDIICHQCNATKGSRTKGEFIKYCRLVTTTFIKDKFVVMKRRDDIYGKEVIHHPIDYYIENMNEFLSENIEFTNEPTDYIFKQDLFKLYKSKYGRSYTWAIKSVVMFGRVLHKTKISEYVTANREKLNGKRMNCWIGVKYK